MKSRFVGALLLAVLSSGTGSAQKRGGRNPLSEFSEYVRELTGRVSPAVVEIVVSGYTTAESEKNPAVSQISHQTSSASGVIVDPGGYIITNAHVVQGASKVRVLIPSARSALSQDSPVLRTRSLDAHTIGIDSESDLALIRVDQEGLPSLSFGDSDQVRQGDLVLAIGSPMGLHNSVSMGVVSAAARALGDDNPILYIQTDASINPGNSGGALVDTSGELVGLNTYIVSSSGGSEGIGFAIPSNVVRNVYQQLKQKGKVSRGSVGLFVQDISPVMAKGLGLSLQQGVVIADVEPDSPADIAGLKRRDVILSLNSKLVESARQFAFDIYRRQTGEHISMETQRGTSHRSVSVAVKEEPAPWDPLAALASPEKNLIPRLGILCIEIDKDVARLLPELRRSYGIIVAAKAPQNQTQAVDLQPGDIIHAVNNIPIAVLSAFREIIHDFQAGDAVVLQIERNGRFRYIAFEID